jgi:hypothetical protein
MWKLKSSRVIAALLLCTSFALCSCSDSSSDSSKSQPTSASQQAAESETVTQTESKTEPATVTEKQTQPETQTVTKTEPSTEKAATTAADPNAEPDYNNNDYYDITDTAIFKETYFNSSKCKSFVVHRVDAKKDAFAMGTATAIAADGSELETVDSERIVLTAGEINYFLYCFTNDVTGLELKEKLTIADAEITDEERKAITCEGCTRSGRTMRMALKRKENGQVNSYSRFKILFLKNDKVVDATSGFISVSAGKLQRGETSADVDLTVYACDFDGIKFIYEP